MGLFNRKKNLPPHKIHPDVLHWKEGDELVYMPIMNGLIVSGMEVDAYPERNKRRALFKSFTPDGFIIVEEKETGNLAKYKFYKFIKVSRNTSHQNRTITSDIEDSKEYMELIDEFQKAYNELEASDKDQKLLK